MSALLSVDETADELGVSRDLVYDLLDRGDLPEVELGRLRKIPRVAVEALVARSLDGFGVTAPLGGGHRDDLASALADVADAFAHLARVVAGASSPSGTASPPVVGAEGELGQASLASVT